MSSFFGIFKGDKPKKDSKNETPGRKDSKDFKISVTQSDSKSSSLNPSPKSTEKKFEIGQTSPTKSEDFAIMIEKTSPLGSTFPSEKHEVDHFYEGMGELDFSLDSVKRIFFVINS
jgi:hypothetical protein